MVCANGTAQPVLKSAAGSMAGALSEAAGDRLLSDAEAAEDFAEQVLAGEFPCDLPQGMLSEAQVLGEQFEGSRAAQDIGSALHMLAGAAQGVEMPAPGGECTGVEFPVSGRRFQVTAQQLQASASSSTQKYPGWTSGF